MSVEQMYMSGFLDTEVDRFTRLPCDHRRTGLPLPAAKDDPQTSALSAEDIEKSGDRRRQIEQVVSCVRNSPRRTSREIAAIHGLDRYMVARRLPDARELGLVRNPLVDESNPLSEPKQSRCSISGKLCVTWEIVER